MASSSTFSKDDDKKSNEIENTDLNDDGNESRDERVNIVDQVYKDKLADIKKELCQLQKGTHVDYVKQLSKLEKIQKDQSMKNSLHRDEMIESIEREYNRDCRLAIKEYGDRRNQLTQTLIAEVNERKKAVLHDYLTTELALDSSDQRPTMTRKLRRRPNDPVIPVFQEKRRNLPPTPVSNINYMLNEHEIEQDIKVIQESSAPIPSTSATATPTVKTCDVNSPSVKKPGFLPISNSSSGKMSPENNHNSDSEEELLPTSDTRIEDGKLLFEKRWYHRGQPIFVEEKQMAQFPAVISAIGSETIWVKKTDNSKFRIKLSYLSKGRMSIKRRAV